MADRNSSVGSAVPNFLLKTLVLIHLLEAPRQRLVVGSKRMCSICSIISFRVTGRMKDQIDFVFLMISYPFLAEHISRYMRGFTHWRIQSDRCKVYWDSVVENVMPGS